MVDPFGIKRNVGVDADVTKHVHNHRVVFTVPMKNGSPVVGVIDFGKGKKEG
jgi:hypothetical protein